MQGRMRVQNVWVRTRYFIPVIIHRSERHYYIRDFGFDHQRFFHGSSQTFDHDERKKKNLPDSLNPVGSVALHGTASQGSTVNFFFGPNHGDKNESSLGKPLELSSPVSLIVSISLSLLKLSVSELSTMIITKNFATS